jgi:hypothetical protein
MQFSYDSQLAALIGTDATSIDGVVTVLQAMDAVLDGTRDGLKWFNTLYLQVTLAVRDSGPARFIADLDFQFADLYFAALRGWLGDGELPESWRILFAQRANARLMRVQFALAGVNAHINRDLAVAVVKTCGGAGIAVRHETAEYQQYTALNGILDGLIERAKRELLVSLPGDVLPGTDQVEQVVAGWSVAAAREAAWVHAEILEAIAGESVLAGRFVSALDGTAALAGKALLLEV